MRTLIHLFEMFDGRPHDPIGMADAYEALFMSLLEGDDQWRLNDNMLCRWTNGDDRAVRIVTVRSNAARLVASMCGHDPVVREILSPRAAMDDDDATYGVNVPDDLSQEELDAFNGRLESAFECLLDQSASNRRLAMRRVLSEQAAAHGIAFASSRAA